MKMKLVLSLVCRKENQFVIVANEWIGVKQEGDNHVKAI